ncbi:c-type cytochrome [Elioraea rosea]|uniref:c-type cytochrome n=1 Tax=Elioraea rosea TaxID=2492390 RepID=UPI0011844664|nr:c-type cytochrome [Elioraea rosea]
MFDLRCLVVVSAVLLAPWNAFASAELARSKNCVACHSVERRMIGPPFKDIAGRYANDGSAVQTLSQRIREGTVGNWGQMPMPEQPQVSQDDAEALTRWILSLQ